MRIFLFLTTVLSLFLSPLSAAIKAVAFDFGGVMTQEPNRTVVVEFLCHSFDLSLSEFERVNQEKRKAIANGMTDEAFWLKYAETRGIKLPPEWITQLKAAYKEAIHINPDMYVLVSELKAKNIPVAMLSNIDERLARLVRDCGLYEPFDPCLFSYEIGVEKPDPCAYTILAERLNLPPSDILFIDDKEENTLAAQREGLDAILFTTVDELRSELKKRALLL